MATVKLQNRGRGETAEFTGMEGIHEDLALAKGSIIYATATGFAKLAIGTTGQVLTVDASGVPKWVTPT